jgi:hypothetical protein
MKYQLVLQFIEMDIDTLLSIEDALIEGLGSTADVDGHDLGSGEANVFIFTSEPQATLQKSREVLQSKGLLPGQFRAASRPVTGESYTTLWPPGESQFHIT